MIDKAKVSPNTFKFRFELPRGEPLGLPVGKHILLKYDTKTVDKKTGQEKDEAVSRPYTPISSNDDKGYFELVIKTYPGGKMSQHLANLDLGKTILVRGPLGALTYHGLGNFSITRKTAQGNQDVKYHANRLGLIAGGTGITPMLQVIRHVLKNPKDRTQTSLIFGNVTEDDILLREELEKCATEHKDIFKLYHTLNQPPAGWTQGSGFVTPDMISKHLPGPADDTLILMCGPPPMVEALKKHMAVLNYSPEMYFEY